MIHHLAYADAKCEVVTDVVALDESATTRNGTTIRSRVYLHHQAHVLAVRPLYLSNMETPQ